MDQYWRRDSFRPAPEARLKERTTTSESDPVYSIAVAARLTGMHPQTLRKYERAGLLQPFRRTGRHRLYSEMDVHRLLRIQYLVEERGLNVAGLGMVLEIVDRLDAIDLASGAEQLAATLDEITGPSRIPREPDGRSTSPARHAPG